MSGVIHGFKYNGLKRNARFLSAFARYQYGLKNYIEEYDSLVPVPLHPLKQRERGFNQATLIARSLSSFSGVRCDKTSLNRRKYTKTQTRLSGTERVENINSAFVLNRKTTIQGKKLLLVDDVFTTGATSEECAKTLLTGGASSVGVITLARTGLNTDVDDYGLELELAGSFLT
ncbi:MAG: ComF family protein [Fibrobacteria bacterium]|nr:ComF family protein [Fibrobacteria bacterium]